MKRIACWTTGMLVLLGAATRGAGAQEIAPDTLLVAEPQRAAAFSIEPLLVFAERTFSAASAGTIRQVDLSIRPRQSAQDLLRLAPGLVIAQHAGGGKAEQIFLRGFDADHGTDVAISVDGTPVNIVSHAHGQGYADLHFLLPEAVERIEVRKGPYDTQDGDFATAGAIALHTRDRIDAAEVKVEAGSFENRRVLVTAPLGGDRRRGGGWLGVAVQSARGPFLLPQDLRRVNFFGKYTTPIRADAEAVVSASGFTARWNQSGQIPERAVRAGLLQRFGSVDGSEGGRTGRYDVALGLQSKSGGWHARAYLTRYDFELFSNFTFFLNDTINGDGIGQTDHRYVAGLSAMYVIPVGGARAGARLRLGAGNRNDIADVALFKQRERAFLSSLDASAIVQNSAYSFADYETQISARWRVQAGLRADALNFSVADQASARQVQSSWRLIASPKANVAFQATSSTAVFANFGSGFHSNDARMIRRADTGAVLPRALGAELGTRNVGRRATWAFAAWWLDLENELVYVGDEGTVEAAGASRRIGVDLELRAQVGKWLFADLDLNVSHGKFLHQPARNSRIPLAPALTSTGGLLAQPGAQLEAGLRYRLIGSRPANETGTVTAKGHMLWQAFARWTQRRLTIFSSVENLLDARWNEAQFDTASRLQHESEGVSELHFTPGAPRTISFGMRYQF